MARLARIVIPGEAHHVTQRGNRREPVFFEDEDYGYYKYLLAETAKKAGCEIWCYCLMPNHVHIIAVPSDEDGLRRTFGDVHRRYTRRINARNKWTGHLWQGRFGAVVMDENHLANAVRYVSLNPVRAKLVKRAKDWPWSSVRAHLSGKDDGLVKTQPVLGRYGKFGKFLDVESDQDRGFKLLRQAETTGRPLGNSDWIKQLEDKTGRKLAKKKRGPKPRSTTCI